MGLQHYEVGSEVDTPHGPGIVVKHNRARQTVTVHGERYANTYSIRELEGHCAARLSAEQMEGWLEAPEPRQESTGLLTTQRPCTCSCGTKGGCYWTVRGGRAIMHFTNGCGCRDSNCACRPQQESD